MKIVSLVWSVHFTKYSHLEQYHLQNWIEFWFLDTSHQHAPKIHLILLASMHIHSIKFKLSTIHVRWEWKMSAQFDRIGECERCRNWSSSLKSSSCWMNSYGIKFQRTKAPKREGEREGWERPNVQEIWPTHPIIWTFWLMITEKLLIDKIIMRKYNTLFGIICHDLRFPCFKWLGDVASS